MNSTPLVSPVQRGIATGMGACLERPIRRIRDSDIPGWMHVAFLAMALLCLGGSIALSALAAKDQEAGPKAFGALLCWGVTGALCFCQGRFYCSSAFMEEEDSLPS